MSTDTDDPALRRGLGIINPGNYTLIEQAGGKGSYDAVARNVLSHDASCVDGFGLGDDMEMGRAIVDDAVKAMRYAWLLTQEQRDQQPSLVNGPWVNTTRIVDAGIHAIVLRPRLLRSIEQRLDSTRRWALEHVTLDNYDGNHSGLVDEAWEGMTTRGLEPRAVLWRKQAALVASPIRWYRIQ